MRLQCTDKASMLGLASVTSEIATLTSSSEVEVLAANQLTDKLRQGCAPAVVDETTVVHMVLTDFLDPVKELDKLRKNKVCKPLHAHARCH